MLKMFKRPVEHFEHFKHFEHFEISIFSWKISKILNSPEVGGARGERASERAQNTGGKNKKCGKVK